MRDAGLQPERTALAWQRTGLSMLVNSGLLLRAAMQADSAILLAVSLTLLCAAPSAFWLAAWRQRALLRGAGPRSPHCALMVALVVTVVIATAAGLLSVLNPAGASAGGLAETGAARWVTEKAH